MRVLGLVPARGGSKGIPRKNIRLLEGRPLLAYTAETALAARSLARVVLSTDDSEIAQVGAELGLEVPFLRPPELATDTAPTLPVVQHAVRTLEAAGDRFDAICLLQATNPLREPNDIDACVELLERELATAVISILPVPHEYNPHWVYFETADRALRLATGESAPLPRRQELPRAFHREGSIYVTRRNTIIDEDTLYGSRVLGYVMQTERSVNLDEPEDWLRATDLLRKRETRAGAVSSAR